MCIRDSKEAFRVRVGDQYLDVESSEKVTDDKDSAVRWTFAPDSPVSSVDADAIAELVPVAESMKTVVPRDYKLVNPFALYEATLIVSGRKSIEVGQAFALKARVDGVRPGIRTTFEFGKHPEGMTIKTVQNEDGQYEGQIDWQTEADQESGSASLEVFAKIEGRSSRLTGSLSLIHI